jgi:hypothetical protein
MGVVAFNLMSILGMIWLARARAARRLHATLDAYAEREIERERHRNGPQVCRVIPPRRVPCRVDQSTGSE